MKKPVRSWQRRLHTPLDVRQERRPLRRTEDEDATITILRIPHRTRPIRLDLAIEFLARCERVASGQHGARVVLASLVTWMYESGDVTPGAEEFPDTPVRPTVLVRRSATEPLLTTITSDDPGQVPRIRRRIVEARGDLAKAMAGLGKL